MLKYILFLFAFLVVACSNNNNKELINQETGFVPEMLGLTPGSTTAEVNFAWYSGSGEKSFVRVFEGSKLVATEVGISGKATEDKYFHKVTAKNLKPNTEYVYRVSSDSINWSEKYKYKTPQTEMFKFAAVGDPQLTTGEQDFKSEWFSSDRSVALGWRATVEKIKAANVDFIISLGDQVDDATNEKEYENFFAPPALRNIPLAPTVGNHDRHYLFQCHFNLPNEQNFSAENYGNYFYLYNNILFVALNTSAYPASAEEAKPYIEMFDSTITAAKTKFKGKYKWIIVQHHKSTRSLAVHATEVDIKYYVEAGFEKLMDKHKVDFVLAGHDHIYVRSNLGAIYMTLTTASGLKYYDLSNNISNLLLSTNMYAQNKIPGYAIFEVKGNSISVSVNEVDKDTHIDEFRVEK